MRDPHIFTYFLKNILPGLIEKNATSKRLRLWSAGCAGGQEPYSLAMLLSEEESLRGWTVDITATDVSRDIIEQAKKGIYSHFEAQRGLPMRLLLKHFTQNDTFWHLSADIKSRVSFHVMNLLNDFSQLGPMDAVFCRNVLIYLDGDTKKDILKRFHTTVRPHGVLVLGAIEAFSDNKDMWADANGAPGIFKRL